MTTPIDWKARAAELEELLRRAEDWPPSPNSPTFARRVQDLEVEALDRSAEIAALRARAEAAEKENHAKTRALMQRDELLQAAEARAEKLQAEVERWHDWAINDVCKEIVKERNEARAALAKAEAQNAAMRSTLETFLNVGGDEIGFIKRATRAALSSDAGRDWEAKVRADERAKCAAWLVDELDGCCCRDAHKVADKLREMKP